uniref:NADH dehydrogenase subunit 5 n=1 Tax=Stethoconus japonicus TaxID=1929845 RepID=UPI0022F2DEA8|nr:NADH dehydrogenase subunit 5 [Stethoconus japonicus]UFQ24461.1 NADH dehydrogenase subunit 5 [Stethoconus japonicus]
MFFVANFMYIIISSFLFLISLALVILGLYFYNFDLTIYLDWEFFSLNGVTFCMSFILDYMSLVFMSCVLLISSMVIMYSYSYMHMDENSYRFLVLVFMFVVSMMFMVISPNMISILLGWDGLGLVSYCLVIYFQNMNSYNSGMLTIMSNRIGDVAILICISWMLNFGSWNYIYYLGFYEHYFNEIFTLVVLASFTSSAQIPFSSWLPAAMAAPTPVSALVHSSTLVTAGVYLVIRFSPVIYMYNCNFFLFISMMTMFMSGLGANFEFDLKSIIALSTLSQLGFMMGALFMGFPGLAFFHLLAHAFFKALLFLCAGLIIHVMSGFQDIRFMGFISELLPYTFSMFLISSLSLCGFPFLSGFYSKDLLLEMMTMTDYNMYVYFLFMFSVSLTVSYTLRLINYMVVKGSNVYVFQSYCEDKLMMFSMVFMVLFSIVFGNMFTWVFMKSPIFIIIPVMMKYMPIIMITLGSFLGYIFTSLSKVFFSSSIVYVFMFMGSMWFMPLFSTYMLYTPFLNISFFYSGLIDMGWGEYFFSRSFMSYFYMLSFFNQSLEKNNIKLYMVSFLFMMFMLLLL